MKRKKGFYSISVVAKMFEVHQQTIRLYEKEGLISPKRSSGNTRLFSEEDVDRLEEIIYLTHKLGVNLAGVEMVLKLQKKIKKLQDDMNKLFDQTQGQLEEDTLLMKDSIKQQTGRLLDMKKPAIRQLAHIAPAPADVEDVEEVTPVKRSTKQAASRSSSPTSSEVIRSPGKTTSKKQPTLKQQTIGEEAQDDWEIDYSDE